MGVDNSCALEMICTSIFISGAMYREQEEPAGKVHALCQLSVLVVVCPDEDEWPEKAEWLLPIL